MSEQKVIRSVEEAQELFRVQFPNGMNGLERGEYERRMRQYFDALMGIDSKAPPRNALLVAGDFNFGFEHEQAPFKPLSALMYPPSDQSGAVSEALFGYGFGDDYRYISHLLEKKSD
jgi:hypothetical protein